MVEKYFLAAMGGAIGLGNKSIAHLVKVFGNAQTVWSADVKDLLGSGVRRNALEAFIEFRRQHPDAPKRLVDYCERHKIKLCSIFDDDYPPILKEIDTPPMFFYYRGQLEPHAQRIAIVGTRDNTPYGQSVALELGRDLAAAGLTVVSGAARGIDTFAHRGALLTGRTVAVLGSGISIVPSHEKRKLFEQIVERGVVFSEFPPDLRPNAGTFPPRNRIIAGLCKGVIVVEAGKRSGALITSTFACEYGRDVFAIPGQVYADSSFGCNELIRDDATLIKSAQDVLDEYNIAVNVTSGAPEVPKPLDLSETAVKVLEIIPADKFITDDEILMSLDELNPWELPNIIIELDRKGCVEEDAGRYRRKVEVPRLKPKPVALSDDAAKVLEIIPADKFITDDEILMQCDELSPNDIPSIMYELELKGCVETDANRYRCCVRD